MKILLIGSGGREHALAWKISQSSLLTKLYCCPGNPGMACLGDNIALDVGNHAEIVKFCLKEKIDLVVIGPELPLVDGLSDSLRSAAINVFGPSAAAARLEGSKGFTKDLCARYNIPTAAYRRFDELQAAKAYIKQQGTPIVIKADGLAAGKGVTVAMSMGEADEAVEACFAAISGINLAPSVVIEEFLTGEEVSFFCLCDGKTAIDFGAAQDHKRVGEGDQGPNTGGMGAYSPAPIFTQSLREQVMAQIITPTLVAMQEMGTPFSGVLFAGLILTRDGPKLIEYNVRFGDPECQSLMLRLDDDVVPWLVKTATGQLGHLPPNWHDETVVNVVLAAQGYPDAPQKGSIISGLEKAAACEGVEIFHAGTLVHQGNLVANGGRVLNIVARGADVGEARARAYAAIDKIDWPQGFCRRDIGAKAL